MGFAQHQSFHIREGWLRKGMSEVYQDEAIFTDPEAYIRFGLGKNMVEALRFWMTATGLTAEVIRQDRKRIQQLTTFGRLVLANDPYLEDDGSLWLIHYHLLKKPEGATTWYWFFNHFARLTFERDHCINELTLWNAMQGTKDIAKSSLEKDIDCLIRTYLPREQATSPEDTLECPLVHLKLFSLEISDNHKRYNLNRPAPRSIPPLVLLYVLKNWQEEKDPNALQVSLRDTLSSRSSPGRTFLLGMRLAEAFRWAGELYPDLGLYLTRTAGLDLITLPQASSAEILNRHFQVGVLH
jgi:hypothetical protein